MITAILQAAVLSINTGLPDDVLDKSRMEKMLNDGDTIMVMHVFKRASDQTLPFIDQYLEGGLKMIEDGEDPGKALESFRIGVQFAELTQDAGLGRNILDYAASFASWSPKEQKQFREGQQAYKAGRQMKDNPEEALKHYERSLELAEPLHDLWGEAMARSGVAQSLLELGKIEEAEQHAHRSAQLYASIMLRRSRINALLIAADCRTLREEHAHAAATLRSAWREVKKDDPEKFRQGVLDAYLAALDASGNVAEAAKVRNENGLDDEEDS